MATPDQIERGYQLATQAVRARVLAYVTAVWSSSPAFRDADVDRIVARIVPVVRAGQMQVAQLTDSYIGGIAAASGVSFSTGVLPNVADYRGVPADVVYRRPAVQAYTALSQGASFADAVSQGLDRLVSIASTDIQQAKNRQAQASTSRSGFNYFQRRLTGNENCAFCVIASTQRYHRGDLMPLHPGCDCGVLPFNSAKDPGQIINPELLAQTHELIDQKLGYSDRGAREAGLNKQTSSGKPISDFTELVVTHEHGELGPTLAWRGEHFTGPSDIPAVLAD